MVWFASLGLSLLPSLHGSSRDTESHPWNGPSTSDRTEGVRLPRRRSISTDRNMCRRGRERLHQRLFESRELEGRGPRSKIFSHPTVEGSCFHPTRLPRRPIDPRARPGEGIFSSLADRVRPGGLRSFRFRVRSVSNPGSISVRTGDLFQSTNRFDPITDPSPTNQPRVQVAFWRAPTSARYGPRCE